MVIDSVDDRCRLSEGEVYHDNRVLNFTPLSSNIPDLF
jgi:hypothetical protein